MDSAMDGDPISSRSGQQTLSPSAASIEAVAQEVLGVPRRKLSANSLMETER
jgi:hypothetical protein